MVRKSQGSSITRRKDAKDSFSHVPEVKSTDALVYDPSAPRTSEVE